MKSVVLACQTLKDELNLAMQVTGCHHQVIWVESDYHIDPDKLRTKLQQEIDSIQDVDNILFGFGCCGNALVGLKATTSNLIIPKTDDCISFLLTKPNQKFERRKGTYFLTKGWIEGSKCILNEYTYTLARYGTKRAERLFELMLGNYNDLMLIDTGAYKINDYLSRVNEFTSTVHLNLLIEKGEIWFLEKLLKGPYDRDFCNVPQGHTVMVQDFLDGF